MDFMEQIAKLRAEKAQLYAQAEQLVGEDKIDEASAITDQMETIDPYAGRNARGAYRPV